MVNAVYHLFVIRSEERDEMRTYLSKFNIGTGIHYPIPLHLQKAYSGLGYREGDFPVAERVAQQLLSLPMYPQITAEQQREVADRYSRLYPKGRTAPPAFTLPSR